MKYTFAALMTGLVILLGILGHLYFSFQTQMAPSAEQKIPAYHFAIITQDAGDPFWMRFKKGAAAAGAEHNLYVEFIDIAHRDARSLQDAVDRAILANVDAIAFQPVDIQLSTQCAQKIKDAGIAALTFENDVFYIEDMPTVGSNNYEIGLTAGRMAVRSAQGVANVVILINDSGADNKYNNIKVQGIMEAFSAWPGMKAENIYPLDTRLFQIEKLTTNFLSENPQIDLIMCFDERSTPGVAQVLIDLDKVGEIAVIGYGTMPQTMRYIQSGVIYGTLSPDSYQIGFECVTQLFDLLEGGRISEYVDTQTYAFTAQNMDEYHSFVSEENEQAGK